MLSPFMQVEAVMRNRQIFCTAASTLPRVIASTCSQALVLQVRLGYVKKRASDSALTAQPNFAMFVILGEACVLARPATTKRQKKKRGESYEGRSR